MGLGLIEDFATWTEKTRRKLLREGGQDEKVIWDQLPAGVPVSLPEALEFIDALLEADPPGAIAERARKWRKKLCQMTSSRHGRSSLA